MYPEKIRMMTRLNKDTHKMTIIGKVYNTANIMKLYGQVIKCMNDQFLLVKMQFDIEL